jgi:hypothetical protein
VRKLAAPFVVSSLAVVLMGAGVAVSIPENGAGPHVFTASGLTLKLTSSTPGVIFIGNSIICPPLQIMASSGINQAACEFKIESTGAVAPGSLGVIMTVSGISPAQAAAHKFAIDPQPGPLVHFGTTSQTLYILTGADLPVTVNPGVVWGANSGSELDNSDLGSTIVVAYTVVAESLEGATGTPVASGTEIVDAATGAPGQTSTPPPTGSAGGPSGNDSSPLFALLICFLLGLIGLAAVGTQRRSVRP